MESIIPKILGMIVGFGIAYLIFKWNRKNKQSKIYYIIAGLFLVGALYMPFAKTVSPEQEAIESSKSESISIKESRKSSIRESSSIKSSVHSQRQTNIEDAVTYLSNTLNDKYNDTFTVSYDKKQDKIIMVCHNQELVNIAKKSGSDDTANEEWIKFEGVMHDFSHDMMLSRYNIRVPFVIEDDNGTKLLEVKNGYTVYNIIDNE